jgi:hypothetical protein
MLTHVYLYTHRRSWRWVLFQVRCILVAVAIAELLYPCAVLAAKRKQTGASAPLPPHVQKLTRLRASPPSLLVGGRGGTQEVRYISVEVANVGTVEASGIQVSIPGGAALSFPLRGPKKLGVGMRGTYVSTVRVPVGVSLQPHAIATCSTCRR